MNAGRIFLQMMRWRFEGVSCQAYTIVLDGALCEIWRNIIENGSRIKRRHEVMNL